MLGSIVLLSGILTVPVIANASQLYFDINFEENIIFDKYNVDLYLDDDKIDTLQHGEAYTKLVDVEDDGKHILTFYKEDDHSISEMKPVEFNGDTTFSCRVVSHSDEIDIKDIEIESGVEAAHLEMIDLTRLGLADAYKQLKDIGFININSENQKGSSVSSSNSYIVLEQSVSVGEKIDKNDEIVLTCQKVSEFMDEHFLGLGIEEAKNVAEELGYDCSFYHKITDKDMNSRIDEFDSSEIEKWGVQGTELDNNVAVLYLVYEGSKECPEVVGLSLAEAEKLLEASDFPNHDYEVVTNDWVWDKSNWQLLYQSVEFFWRIVR